MATRRFRWKLTKTITGLDLAQLYEPDSRSFIFLGFLKPNKSRRLHVLGGYAIPPIVER